MKRRLDFDPERCSYGAATLAVRRILREWAEVDWFVPPRGLVATVRATRLFSEHHALARSLRPDLFEGPLEVELVRGNFADFAALCERVRQPGMKWDWKYGALKQLSYAHSRAHGFSLENQTALAAEGSPTPGFLFFRVGDHVMWNPLMPKLELEPWLTPAQAELAAWYLGYADMDVGECIEWQLAERSDDLSGNPFAPLLRCYAEGCLPFGIGPSEVILFAFDR